MKLERKKDGKKEHNIKSINFKRYKDRERGSETAKYGYRKKEKKKE